MRNAMVKASMSAAAEQRRKNLLARQTQHATAHHGQTDDAGGPGIERSQVDAVFAGTCHLRDVQVGMLNAWIAFLATAQGRCDPEQPAHPDRNRNQQHAPPPTRCDPTDCRSAAVR